MKVLHKTTSSLDIELETTALYTSFQEIQEPWLLALSLGAKQCHGCEIPPTLPLLKPLHYLPHQTRTKNSSLQTQSLTKFRTPTASLHLTALKPGFLSPSVVELLTAACISQTVLRSNVRLQLGPDIRCQHPLQPFEPTLSTSLSLCTQASCMHATAHSVAISHCIVPLQPDLLSLLPLALPSHDIAP